ncbi:hypothetical protein SESBI_17724 [Sesbania bispinosa]|nr:hypothetical protein SESBI_17724 [Sesbania bispinosa]
MCAEPRAATMVPGDGCARLGCRWCVNGAVKTGENVGGAYGGTVTTTVMGAFNGYGCRGHDYANNPNVKKPEWLRQRAPHGDRFREMQVSLSHLKLNTISEEAQRPNIGEFFIVYVRALDRNPSRFWAVKTSRNPTPPDPREPRNTAKEDLWRETFPVGTEWDQLDFVYQYKWNFSNLENAFEEGGVLHGKKVYLFAQLVWFKEESKVVCIPVVVAVVSPFPPSDKIGINSVQREAEEIIPMKQMKMDWVPYIPLEDMYSTIQFGYSGWFI